MLNTDKWDYMVLEINVIIYFIKLEADAISNRLKLSTEFRKIKF